MSDANRRRATLAEQDARGRALRQSLRRRDHDAWSLPVRDPVGLVERQAAGRVPELVPVRVGRMIESPFAFYRGTAAQMAHDLREGARTDVRVVACGDAHVGNFGFYASPERRLVFDLNDFDEANVGPWEWDLKRLATSAILAGRDAGLSDADCLEAAQGAARAYRAILGRLYTLSALERFSFRVESDALAARASDSDGRRAVRKAVRKARGRTSESVVHAIATTADTGEPRIVDQPPVLRHMAVTDPETMRAAVDAYRESAQPDVSVLLSQYELADAAFRVVGVGSVGLRSHLLLLTDPAGAPLVLQAKEAIPSVLVTDGGMPFGRAGRHASAPPAAGREAWRVVTGQRVMQAVSDRFLGWFAHGGREYYVRQFRDMKGAIDLSALSPSLLADYTALCAALLARAHAQSPDGAVIHGYLRGGDRFDAAIARWAGRYADQAERDHAGLVAAVHAGRLQAATGV